MSKKIIVPVILVLIVLVFAGGFFYFWQSQKDARELNKTLPKGVMVVKSFLGKEYKVVNKIDGYEFKLPKEWGGISQIEYIPERTEQEYVGASVSVEGKEGEARILTVGRAKIENFNSDLEFWAKNFFNTFNLVGEFSKVKIGELEIVKTQEKTHLGGMWAYFFKNNDAVYILTNGSGALIERIISNGKW